MPLSDPVLMCEPFVAHGHEGQSLATTLQEASWNPYYAHLALKLAAAGKSHRFTLQYCLWDQVGTLPPAAQLVL